MKKKDDSLKIESDDFSSNLKKNIEFLKNKNSLLKNKNESLKISCSSNRHLENKNIFFKEWD